MICVDLCPSSAGIFHCAMCSLFCLCYVQFVCLWTLQFAARCSLRSSGASRPLGSLCEPYGVPCKRWGVVLVMPLPYVPERNPCRGPNNPQKSHTSAKRKRVEQRYGWPVDRACSRLGSPFSRLAMFSRLLPGCLTPICFRKRRNYLCQRGGQNRVTNGP